MDVDGDGHQGVWFPSCLVLGERGAPIINHPYPPFGPGVSARFFFLFEISYFWSGCCRALTIREDRETQTGPRDTIREWLILPPSDSYTLSYTLVFSSFTLPSLIISTDI